MRRACSRRQHRAGAKEHVGIEHTSTRGVLIMRSNKTYTVYLAGPMRGCNDTQRQDWRRKVKDLADKSIRFIDPAADPVAGNSPYQLVARDIQSIESADAVLANMWRESLGTAIGLVHARAKGRIVVVVDPNHLENPFLDFYADVVVKTLKEGIHATADLLRSSTFSVLKHRGRSEEPFDREKLVQSVRAAARAARKNDITVPSLVLRRVTDALARSDRKVGKEVTTSDIEHFVLEALEAMEADAEHSDAVTGIRDQWKKKVRSKPSSASRPAVPKSDDVVSQRVPIHGSKSHGSIWGKGVRSSLDVPSPARDVLMQIVSVPGVSEIRLQTFGKGPKRYGVGAHVNPPTDDGSIYGYIVDPQGRKGQKQSFAATVLEHGSEDRVYQAIVNRLKARDYWLGSD
jgi:nucleoside 2-deoxyribosyltransferase